MLDFFVSLVSLYIEVYVEYNPDVPPWRYFCLLVPIYILRVKFLFSVKILAIGDNVCTCI